MTPQFPTAVKYPLRAVGVIDTLRVALCVDVEWPVAANCPEKKRKPGPRKQLGSRINGRLQKEKSAKQPRSDRAYVSFELARS